MHTHSCGNCGYPLPGPVGQCPRCGVLLRGEREGDEGERLRRDHAYRRNRPEAVARRRRIRGAFETAGGVLATIALAALALTVFVGGGAALGWLILPRLFGREAAIPLTVAGAILGGLLLYLFAWRLLNLTVPGWTHLTGKPDWLDAIDREAKEKDRAHQSSFLLLMVLAYLLSILLLGPIGWQLWQNNVDIISIISLLGGLAAAYLAKRFLGAALEFSNLVVIFVLTAYGINQGLIRLFGALGWNAEISNPNVGALGGILAGLPLAYFLAKRLAGPPPDTWTTRKDAITAAIVEYPARILDLDSYDRDHVLSKLKELAEAAPEHWQRVSPELQKLVPLPRAAAAPTCKARSTTC